MSHFDSVLLVSFGGPGGLDDIRPFLANVLRGRRVPPERVEEVAKHYEHFDGVSPLTEYTMRQARGIEQRLRQKGLDLPVFVGMRNWHPYLADTLSEMAEAGRRRAIGLISAAHHSYSSCAQYKQNVINARRELRQRGHDDIAVTYVDSWFEHPGFIRTIAEHIDEALNKLPEPLREKARLVFTAHSIPMSMANCCQYVEQLTTSSKAAAARLGRTDWTLVYQSRSGRPQDPWLEPDICDYLRQAKADGLAAAVIVPIGFVCDHIEVLHDLDDEAAETCQEVGLPMVRAETVNDDEHFIDALADMVLRKHEQFKQFPPLPIVGSTGDLWPGQPAPPSKQ